MVRGHGALSALAELLFTGAAALFSTRPRSTLSLGIFLLALSSLMCGKY